MSETKATSPWVWIGCGCGIVMLLAVAAVVGLGVFGARKARELQEEMLDPEAREEKALDILGAEAIPDGYHAMLGLKIPFLMEMAMLSDRPAAAGEEPQGFDERGFIYLKMITFGRQQEELRDFFEGKTDNADVLRRQNINLRVGERLSNGEVEREDTELLWVAHRGNIDMMGSRSEGITSLMLFDCPQDHRMRLGIWFGPYSGESDSEANLAGTPADGAAVEAFVQGMRPCS